MSAAVGPRKIGLWMGGSFSPPTFAHIKAIRMAAEALADANKDATIYAFFVPVHENYPKESVRPACISTDHRLAMLGKAVEHLKETVGSRKIVYDVSTIETSAEGPLKTVDSAIKLKTTNGLDKVYIAVGEDNLRSILQGKWSRGNELLGNGIVWFPRSAGSSNITKESIPGVDSDLFGLFEAGSPVRVVIDFETLSSSALRKAMRNARGAGVEADLRIYTLPEIEKYIKENGIEYGPICEKPVEEKKAGGRRRRKTRRHRRRSSRAKN